MVHFDSEENGDTCGGSSATKLEGMEAGQVAIPHNNVKTQTANRVGNHCFHHIIGVQ